MNIFLLYLVLVSYVLSAVWKTSCYHIISIIVQNAELYTLRGARNNTEVKTAAGVTVKKGGTWEGLVVLQGNQTALETVMNPVAFLSCDD